MARALLKSDYCVELYMMGSVRHWKTLSRRIIHLIDSKVLWMSLWSWQELNRALGLAEGRSSGLDISGISIDTRTLKAGDLFVALSGDPGPRFHSSFEGA